MSLVLVCAVIVQTNAQTYLGYTNGNVERKKGVRFGTAEKQGMAIRISAEKAHVLKGTKITALRAAFGTSTLKDIKVFVTRDLNGASITTSTASGASTSFKEFAFSEPYIVDGEEFYVGMTFNVSTSYKPILFDLTSDFAGSLFYALSDNEWVDVTQKGYGGLNLQMVCEAVPEFSDLIVKPIAVEGFVKSGDKRTLEGQIFNFGTRPAQDFSISYKVGDGKEFVSSYSTTTVNTNTTFDFSLSDAELTGEGRLPLQLNVMLNDATPEYSISDNVVATSLFIYPEWIQKKTLIETFTGQTCGNCPAAHSILEKALVGNEDKFVIVSHHSGYQPDAFTMAEDVDFTWFYNSSSLYAPAIMFDRAPYADGLASIVFEGNDSKLVNNAMKVFPTKEPFISIQLNNKFDASTRQGTLEVEVYTFVNPTEAEHRLNLHLVQDDMVATQSGMGSNYVHHHVFRGCLNGTWGETIELIEGATVKKTIEYTIPEKIISTHANKVSLEAILENMQIVAFVSDAANSPLECIVWNSESIPVLQSADGIGELQANCALTVDVCGQTLRLPSVGNRALVYAISGQTVASFASGESCTLPKGTYVVKVYGKNGETAVKKIIL